MITISIVSKDGLKKYSGEFDGTVRALVRILAETLQISTAKNKILGLHKFVNETFDPVVP